MRDGDPLVNGTLTVWPQVGRATGAQAISLRILEFAPGLSPGLCNADCDEILYVLRREPRHAGSLAGQPGWVARPVHLSGQSERTVEAGKRAHIFIDGNPYTVDPDTGIYLRPGETLAVNNPGPDAIVIVSCHCPEPESPLDFATPLTAPAPDSTPPRSPLVSLADRPAQPTADRWYRVLVDDEVGSTQATQFVGSIPPGRAPDHFHTYEEVLFILKGEGRMWAGESNTPIAPGSCIYLPKGQVHCVENTGKDELRLLGVFYPAGSPSVRYDV